MKINKNRGRSRVTAYVRKGNIQANCSKSIQICKAQCELHEAGQK